MKWIKKNKTEFILLAVLILVTAFLRFYKIEQYMTFLGDEGRDALVIKRILTTFDLPLLGPPTSIGNMYLGPLYYYMMSVPMAIFWLNPVSAAGMVAMIGTLTVGLIYFLAKKWFGREAAFLAAILYAVSPVTITYSRSSWNPNPAPFFTLLAFWGLFKVHKDKNFMWLIVTGIALAFAVQMHYLALILIPVFGLLWLNELILNRSRGYRVKNIITGSSLAVLIFLILMSPLVIFDLKHDFVNYRALTTFFGNRETTVNLNPFNTLERVLPIYSQDLVGRYISGENKYITWLLSILILSPLVFSIWLKYKKREVGWSFWVLGLWIVIGVSGLALYKQTIYDHYLGFLAPAPYLLLGGFIFYLKDRLKLKVALGLLFLVGFYNLQKFPLLSPPNNQLERTQRVARFVIEEAKNKPFNFALLSAHNYDAAYQFYLDIYGYKPRTLPFNKTEQLFVVCEDQVCNPVGHAKYEIAAFGWAKIEYEKQFGGVRIFKLVPNEEATKSSLKK